jgi:hypothetical protein
MLYLRFHRRGGERKEVNNASEPTNRQEPQSIKTNFELVASRASSASESRLHPFSNAHAGFNGILHLESKGTSSVAFAVLSRGCLSPSLHLADAPGCLHQLY